MWRCDCREGTTSNRFNWLTGYSCVCFSGMYHQDVDLNAMWAAAVEANGGDASDQHMDEFWDKLQVRFLIRLDLWLKTHLSLGLL